MAPELFERAIALESKAEACYFEFGRYLDSLMRDARQRQAAKAARARGGSSAAAALPDRFNGRVPRFVTSPHPLLHKSKTGSTLAAWGLSCCSTLGAGSFDEPRPGRFALTHKRVAGLSCIGVLPGVVDPAFSCISVRPVTGCTGFICAG